MIDIEIDIVKKNEASQLVKRQHCANCNYMQCVVYIGHIQRRDLICYGWFFDLA